MQKIILPISKCIPGMITAQPIVDMQTGVPIIGQNQVLTKEHLAHITKFIHTDIWIYLDSFDKVWNLPPETIESYKKYSQVLHSVIKKMSPLVEGTLEDFESISSNIISDFKDNHVLVGCTDLIKKLDYTLYTHSINVAFLCTLICNWTHASQATSRHAIEAALLHDIGSINLSFDMTKNIEKMTAEELYEYEKHPIYGYNIVSKIKELDPAIAKGILAHHEKCDGTGFPLKLTKPYINEVARILSIADAYEILRKKHHVFDTLKIMLTDELLKYDPDKLLTFCHYIANYYIGVFVTLNTGDIGEVVFINPRCIYKPIIKINENYINLYESPAVHIINVE